jgi:membrane-associated phospholipid phosphatase
MDEIVSIGELCGQEPTIRLRAALFFSRSVECFIFGLAFIAAYELNGRKFIFFLANLGNIVISIVLKNIVRQGRPPDSCLASFGMPSTHAQIVSFATTVMIFMSFRRLRSKTRPLSEWYVAVYRTIVTVFFVWSVTWSRVVLGHHTVAQVAAGTVVGVVVAFVAVMIVPHVVRARKTGGRPVSKTRR